MGYLDSLLGSNEKIIYGTREHWLALLARLSGWLFGFAVFGAFGAIVLLWPFSISRAVVGVIVLLTVVAPLFRVVRSARSHEASLDILRRIWSAFIAIVLGLIAGLLLILFPKTPVSIWVTAGFAFLVAALFLERIIYILLQWYNERYLITNRRVMVVSGVINKNCSDSALEKVNDVLLKQSVLGRIMNFGDVEILTASELGVNLFKNIAGPVRFKTVMLDQKEAMSKETPPRSFASPAQETVSAVSS